jgi:hypothetical protein
MGTAGADVCTEWLFSVFEYLSCSTAKTIKVSCAGLSSILYENIALAQLCCELID